MFAGPGAPDGRSLADPCVSRRPVHLQRTRDGSIRIDPRDAALAADGRPVEGEHVVPPAALEHGVVLELAGRIVLLLHLTGGAGATTDELGLVGHNDAIDDLRRDILRVAGLDVPVLIRGETGTGKELIARAVHAASRCAAGPFVSVNMAAIPAATAASELFGHARGAFTGAASAHLGYFGEAEGGTLFLDEIGASPREVQPMLLRALESLEIQPLGTAAPRKVQVRIIAATDVDLEQAIAEGSFRAAVYHRLEGYQLMVPPLRARRDDIGRLLVHFVRDELAATGQLDRLAPPPDGEAPWLPPAFVARLARLDWPGNVRQLRNVVRQFTISSLGLPEVRVDAVLERLLDGAEADDAAPAPEAGAPITLSDDDILAALRAAGYQVPAAARALGISRSALYARIRASERIRQARDLGAAEIDEARAACAGDLARMARMLEVSARALALRMKELGLGP